jgi:hypothetical protein
MSDPSDARERLLAFVERVEREHYKVTGPYNCSGEGHHARECAGYCGQWYISCGCGGAFPCDAARAAAAIRAALKRHESFDNNSTLRAMAEGLGRE